jgi:ABC-type amino acid transport substrate-binding protein
MRFFITFALLVFISFPTFAQDGVKESAYDKIMASQTVRCGYIVWPPFVDKDINSGAYSGLVYDVLKEMERVSGLKVVMQEEFGLGTYLQGLNNGRYDLECSGGWQNAKRAQLAEYTKPFAFFPIVAVVKADETRSADLSWVNSADVKVAIIDGETSAQIQKMHFEKAQTVELQQMQNSSDLMLQLSTGKADITFTDMPSYIKFSKANPGTVKAFTENPVRVIPVNFSMAKGEHDLRTMLDVTIDELIYDGIIEKILKKYNTEETIFLPVNSAYEVSK